MPTRVLHNRNVGSIPDKMPEQEQRPLAFHRRLPGYAPAPLVDVPALAGRLGIARLWVKNESSRLGLPAFKILGASWATYRAFVARLGAEPAPWTTLDELRRWADALRPLTLAAATDGNHGRAVAHMAALLGFDAHIFVPAGTAEARIHGIESEGAAVTIVNGTYDEAVTRAAASESERCLVISDTASPGSEEVPRWVIEGYATICAEVDDQLAQHEDAGPDLVVVQIGVGALASAVVRHFRQPGSEPALHILGVEPDHAACVFASMEAGKLVTLPGHQDSIMAGLNCGTPSSVAWPLLATGVNTFVAIEDEWARVAMRALAQVGVVAGETGSAGLAGLLALNAEPPAERARCGLTPTTRALVICTEGATDPVAYARIVGGA